MISTRELAAAQAQLNELWLAFGQQRSSLLTLCE